VTDGVVFFAYNTDQINYVKLAALAGRYVKRHMPNRSVCLVTDGGTWDWFQRTDEGREYAGLAFDDVVLADSGSRENRRTHYDSPWHKFTSDFRNGNKHRVINYTPYDRTLLLDIDYIVQNGSLDYVFDSGSEVTLFHRAESLIGEKPALPQQYLSETGIPMLWSTAVYFDKTSSLAQTFFEVWAHVADNYEFYKFLYGFPGTMYRTDFCVSIATHILNGMGSGELIDDFPHPMINMSQHDDIVKINSADEWIYMVNNRQENWRDSLTKIQGENVHVMNKRSLERNYEAIMQQLDQETE
jgi:hypothetical protein